MSQTLYRFWDAADHLLYAGISVRPWQRWKEHRAQKPWWEEVSKITIENVIEAVLGQHFTVGSAVR